MSDKDWEFDNSPSNLDKYIKEGTDLSSTINQGQKISEFRDLAGLSADEFASRCNIPKRELLALEAGLQTLTPELAKTMASTLGIDTSDLWIASE